MANYVAEGSITIRRLRNGDTLYLSFTTNKIPLYQGVDTDSGAVAPDWTVAANQPELTPKCSTARGNAVTLSGHRWYYNGSDAEITFSGGTVSGDYIISTNYDGRFMLNTKTGGLRICGNLASEDNYANDMLTYKATATVAGHEYDVTKDAEIIIARAGTNAFQGYITATTLQLDSTTTQVVLNTVLYQGLNVIDPSTYSVNWYVGVEDVPSTSGSASLTVTRDMVNGTTMFRAEFVVGGEAVSTYGVHVVDLTDEYRIIFTKTDDLSDSVETVTVVGQVVRYPSAGGNPEYKIAASAWELQVYIASIFEVVRELKTSDGTLTMNSDNTVTTTVAIADCYFNGADTESDIIVDGWAEIG